MLLALLFACPNPNPPPDIEAAHAVALEWVGSGTVRACRSQINSVHCDVVTTAGCELTLNVRMDDYQPALVAAPFSTPVCPGSKP